MKSRIQIEARLERVKESIKRSIRKGNRGTDEYVELRVEEGTLEWVLKDE